MLPSLFISHGSPQLAIMDNKTSKFLKNVSSLFDKPKYILVISAHWVTQELRILSCETPNLIYDFFGFPQELYEKQYAIKNDLDRVNRVVDILKTKDIYIKKDTDRKGYDHGVWAPLSLMYPNADIPVIQISLPHNYTEENLINLGIALRKLRDDTLIISSGSMTHNIKASASKVDAPAEQYSVKFRDWVVNHLENARADELKDFRNKAPYLRENHPTLEHFLPLFVSLGSSMNGEGKPLNNEYMYGNQSMETIIFKE